MGAQIEGQKPIRIIGGVAVQLDPDVLRSPFANAAITFAGEEARLLGHQSVDTAHLFIGLFRTGSLLLAPYFPRPYGVELDRLRKIVSKGNFGDSESFPEPYNPRSEPYTKILLQQPVA